MVYGDTGPSPLVYNDISRFVFHYDLPNIFYHTGAKQTEPGDLRPKLGSLTETVIPDKINHFSSFKLLFAGGLSYLD